MRHSVISEKFRSLDDLYGKKLLQIGSCGQNIWLQPLHFVHKWVLTPCVNLQSTLISSPFHTPLDKNSLDCIIAPFTLEVLPEKREILIELDRMLKPAGFLVIWGMNPISLWGLALKFRRISSLDHAVSGMTSSFSVKKILKDLAYQQFSHSAFFYIPPLKDTYIRPMEFLNEVGKMLWPFPAGFYCLIMQKKVLESGRIGLSYQEARLTTRKPTLPLSGRVGKTSIKEGV